MQQGPDRGGAREVDGGLSHVEGHTPPPQPRAIGTARPTAACPIAAAGHVRQCGGGQDDGRSCPAPQLLLLPPENRDHHHPSAPIARDSSNQGDKCARSGTIGGRRASKPNGLHVLQPVHLHPPRNRQLTTPTAGHRRHTDYGRSGTIGGRHATEPPTRTCIQTGGTTTPATTPRSHSGRGAPGVTCRQGSRTQLHEYGGSRHPTRATPWHRTPANRPNPGPHRRPSSTTPTPTQRVHTRPPAGSPPGSGDTSPSGAPPTPRHTNPANREPDTRNTDPDPTRATVPADTPRSTDGGGQPGLTPVPEGHTRESVQPAGGAATPPAAPAQPQPQEPRLNAREETAGPPQRTEAPPPAADLPAR